MLRRKKGLKDFLSCKQEDEGHIHLMNLFHNKEYCNIDAYYQLFPALKKYILIVLHIPEYQFILLCPEGPVISEIYIF